MLAAHLPASLVIDRARGGHEAELRDHENYSTSVPRTG